MKLNASLQSALFEFKSMKLCTQLLEL